MERDRGKDRFRRGERFTSLRELREYMTVESMVDIFGEDWLDNGLTQEDLDDIVKEIVDDRYHYDGPVYREHDGIAEKYYCPRCDLEIDPTRDPTIAAENLGVPEERYRESVEEGICPVCGQDAPYMLIPDRVVEIEEHLDCMDESFHGGDIEETAREWASTGLTTDTAREYMESGVWDPRIAWELYKAGVPANEVDRVSDEEIGGYNGTVANKASNGDLSIEEVRILTGHHPILDELDLPPIPMTQGGIDQMSEWGDEPDGDRQQVLHPLEAEHPWIAQLIRDLDGKVQYLQWWFDGRVLTLRPDGDEDAEVHLTLVPYTLDEPRRAEQERWLQRTYGLSIRESECYLLHRLGYSYREIAEESGIEPNAARGYVVRAVEKVS